MERTNHSFVVHYQKYYSIKLTRRSIDFQGDREGRPYNTTKGPVYSYIVRATLAVALETSMVF